MHSQKYNGSTAERPAEQYRFGEFSAQLSLLMPKNKGSQSGIEPGREKFITIDDPELKDKIAETTCYDSVAFNRFTFEAPTLVVITATKGNLKTKVGQMISGLPYYLIDIGIAAEHFCLQAAELGLGTCMIGWFNEKRIKQQLKIPKNERIALLIAVGYPKSDEIRTKSRKSIQEIVQNNQ